ncbi:hypothetical protein [Nostoc sp. 2RC]|uniref:ribbon-helix-helix domain-containing protein n=1 Tax=Nostoc sp. 2RC TaxID=2485484 RepID=UPI0016258DE4|nr:hypothetical protein [Nostoc sp. 2RC]MBC1236036.1 hypothetical protein [Nostoc sp. 2RC]
MTKFQILLPELMKAFVDEQVAKGGYGSVSEYLQELIFQDQYRKGQVNDDQFEVVADWLIEEFAACIGANLPVLSDNAVTRESIYEDRP